MNENEIYVDKFFKFDNPLINEIDSMIDSCFRDCHNICFHICKKDYIYHKKLTHITNNKIFNLKNADKSMKLYELNKKLKVAGHRSFSFNQINTLTIKFHSNLSRTNIKYYSKLRIPIMHRPFFKINSQNPDYVKTHCNDRNNPFHFAIRKWYLNDNTQC